MDAARKHDLGEEDGNNRLVCVVCNANGRQGELHSYATPCADTRSMEAAMAYAAGARTRAAVAKLHADNEAARLGGRHVLEVGDLSKAVYVLCREEARGQERKAFQRKQCQRG